MMDKDPKTYDEPPIPECSGEFSCGPTDNPELILEARRLVADVYLKRGFIEHNQITDDGIMNVEADPDFWHSRYYVSRDHTGRIIATARVIKHDHIIQKESFPMIRDHYDELDRESVDAIVASYGWENVLEISNLARDKERAPKGVATTQLYRAIFQDSWNSNDEPVVYVMATNPKLKVTLQRMFGRSIQSLGPELDYPGQPAEPIMFDSLSGALGVIEASRNKKNPYKKLHEEITRFFLDGVDASTLNPQILEQLDRYQYSDILAKIEKNEPMSIDLEREMRRMKRLGAYGLLREKLNHYKPEIVAGGVLTGYTLARTLAVAEGVSPTTDVDWRVFLGIELATTPPYVWAAGDIVRNVDGGDIEEEMTRASRARKIGAYATYYSSLMAPYGYIVANGGTTSTPAMITTAGMAALPLVAKYGKKFVNKNK